MSKIGIMGGTFNPIHNGHLVIAKNAKEQFGLDKVMFITSGNPPHKQGEKILDAQIRHKMVCIAIDGYADFELCDYEVKKEDYSYTADTLAYLKEQNKEDELFLIIGADSLHNLKTWHKPEDICKLCTLLVYSREGYDINKDCEEVKKEYHCTPRIIKATYIDISSTEIRNLLYNKKDVSQLMPDAVLQLITRNDLYLPDEGTIEERIKKRLRPDRFCHSEGVAKKATELANIFGVDKEKAYLAGIAHDCAKNIPYEKMMAKCADYDVELDEDERNNPGLIHAKLGEKVAKIELGITDKEILKAIKWHTLGYPGMGNLEKIIYVADMIEENRNFLGVDGLRAIAQENLDRAVAACAKATIDFNTAKNIKVHPMAYKVFEWFMKNE